MTLDQALKDVEYLANRAVRAGAFCAHVFRDWGISSNSLVSFAYGVVDEVEMPGDFADYAACCRAFDGLPDHRKTSAVIVALLSQGNFLAERIKERNER